MKLFQFLIFIFAIPSVFAIVVSPAKLVFEDSEKEIFLMNNLDTKATYHIEFDNKTLAISQKNLSLGKMESVKLKIFPKKNEFKTTIKVVEKFWVDGLLIENSVNVKVIKTKKKLLKKYYLVLFLIPILWVFGKRFINRTWILKK